jgi:hypothetical protein
MFVLQRGLLRSSLWVLEALTQPFAMQICNLIQDNPHIRQDFASIQDYGGVLLDVLVAALRFIEGTKDAHNFPASTLLKIIVSAPCFVVRFFFFFCSTIRGTRH